MAQVEPNHSMVLADLVSRFPSAEGLDWDGAFHRMWDELFIPRGTWDERCLRWINEILTANYADLPGAQDAYARFAGYDRWSDLQALSGDCGSLTWNGSLLHWNGDPFDWCTGDKILWNASLMTWGGSPLLWL
jgi:hypothetical protein